MLVREMGALRLVELCGCIVLAACAYAQVRVDGRTLAFTRYYSHFDSHLMVMPASGGAERDLGQVCPEQIGWSPDSQFLVAGVYHSKTDVDSCRIVVISAQTGRAVRQLAARGTAPAFSPDGKLLAFADGTALRLLRLTSDHAPAGPAITIATEPREISALTWGRDSKLLLYQVWGDSPYLRRLRLGVGAKPQLITGLSSELEISQLLPDGSALATESVVNTGLWRVDLEARNPTAEMVEARLPGAVVSPDGLRAAYVAAPAGVSQIWVEDADGTNRRLLVRSVPDYVNPPDHACPGNLAWSPDGKWLAFSTFALHGNADVREDLYVVPASGGPLRRLGGNALSVGQPSWSPDGKSIFAVQSTGTLMKWSRDELVKIDFSDGKVTQITYEGGVWPHPAADGKFVYYFSFPYLALKRIPADGGSEERLSDKGDYDLTATTVGTKYLYLFKILRDKTSPLACDLVRFDPETREAVTLTRVPFCPKSAYLSLNRRYLFFDEVDDARRRVVIVRGL